MSIVVDRVYKENLVYDRVNEILMELHHTGCSILIAGNVFYEELTMTWEGVKFIGLQESPSGGYSNFTGSLQGQRYDTIITFEPDLPKAGSDQYNLVVGALKRATLSRLIIIE